MVLTQEVKMAVDPIEIYQIVEQLFDANRKHSGEVCEIPVLGGHYIPGLDRTARLKEKARRALLAREWFAIHGPADAPPLPVSYGEREHLKIGGLSTIVALYARSLEGQNYDLEEHPSFEHYACGMMASEFIGGYHRMRENEQLRNRFPPRPLDGLGPGLMWQPPEEHARTMESWRRCREREDRIHAAIAARDARETVCR
jgi:hypothetical protein